MDKTRFGRFTVRALDGLLGGIINYRDQPDRVEETATVTVELCSVRKTVLLNCI